MIRKSLLVGIALLALALAIPGALCTVSWPEEEWIPMPPDEARPPIDKQIRLTRYYPGGDPQPVLLDAKQPFYFIVAWLEFVRSEAYKAEDGTPVTAYENIQDRSGAAAAIYVVTFDGERLNPTYSYRGIGKWVHFTNTDSSGDYEAVTPLCLMMEHYYVFPNGLDPGEYEVHTELSVAGFPDDNPIRIYDVTLVVSQPSLMSP